MAGSKAMILLLLVACCLIMKSMCAPAEINERQGQDILVNIIQTSLFVFLVNLIYSDNLFY